MSCFQVHPQRICISTSRSCRSSLARWLAGRGYDIFCGFDADAPGDAVPPPACWPSIPPSIACRPPAHDWNDVLTSSRSRLVLCLPATSSMCLPAPFCERMGAIYLSRAGVIYLIANCNGASRPVDLQWRFRPCLVYGSGRTYSSENTQSTKAPTREMRLADDIS